MSICILTKVELSADFRSRSGELNAKNREILALQAQARARLAKTRANFAEGMKAAKDVQRDLDWTQKKVKYVNLVLTTETASNDKHEN